MTGPLILFSGGVDSTVLLCMAMERGESPLALSFMYGAVHQIPEMRAARNIAGALGVERVVCDLRHAFSDLRRASSLTGGRGTPVVPNRNAIMLSVAVGIAEVRGIKEVWMGANADDHAEFPDCRPEFISAFDSVARSGTKLGVSVKAPLVSMTKREVVREARRLGAPLHLVWTCYGHGPVPCGECPACMIRNAAEAP